MTSSGHRPERGVDPPRLARWILFATLPERYRDNQLGDLAEEFRTIAELRGRRAGRRWYRIQALTSVKSNLTLRLRERPTRTRKGDATVETVLQDIRFGARGLRKNPGYAVITALTPGWSVS